ncbi:cell cycle checkpoint protein RAD17 [Phalaenopsis equestris]|uniref:cell cycle checkpoint protein RAD17 n=1 Tax=Phalaenopsis equestris TaxID=78828 RepID=UPI0009E306D0|nr:cell cycle checkpoint protein RAD17 [Phalaenopsis equestris]
MGKRKPVVVLSSSEDDTVRTRSTGRDRATCISSSKPLSAARKKSRGGRSISGSDRGSEGLLSREVEANKFATLSEDFCDCLQDFHFTRGNPSTQCKELWIDKYEPSSIPQLAVNKKKVEEVKNWLEDRLITSKGSRGNVLLLTGQTGVGKSATVRVIASELGSQLYEWTAPTPTLWQEHLHIVNSGLKYMSKLDEFEAFVEKMGKYSLLCPSNAGASRKQAIVVIDDLPITNGRVAFGRLKKCLTTVSDSAQLPVVILITEYHKVGLGDNSTRHNEELVSFLERAGAHKVAFNPLTVNSIKKVLSMLCKEEKCDVIPEQIDLIAKASGGDIRNAITSLQYYFLRPYNLLSCTTSTLMETNDRFDSDGSRLSPFTGLIERREVNFSSRFPFAKDETLTLFHALGKFLHNKREEVDALYLGSESPVLKDRYVRKPLKMDAPELIISQAYGQAMPVTDFLHENVLDFLSDGAMDDAWVVTSYLSDADCLLSSSLHISCLRKFSETYESQSLLQSVACSVAIRGVLFGNSQPLTSRWHAIRSPRLWQIEHSAKKHMSQAMNEKFDTFNGLISSMSQVIIEYRPSMRWLNSHCEGRLDSDKLEHFSAQCCLNDSEDNNSMEESDDEIEDW